jgi:hypothetical protein
VLETMLDVVKRYDVDGIHIDDYFYPYRESRVVTRRVRKKRVRTRVEIVFPDDKTWKKYGRPSGFTDRDAWRRSNIDEFIRALYKGAKAIRPATLVGISPFGIESGIAARCDGARLVRRDLRRLETLACRRVARLRRAAALLAGWRHSGCFRLPTRGGDRNPQGRYIFRVSTRRTSGGNDPWSIGEIATQVTTLRDAMLTGSWATCISAWPRSSLKAIDCRTR